MKVKKIYTAGHNRLLLIFAGWGMHSNMFEHLKHDSHDIAVAWDYKDMRPESEPWLDYDEVSILGWSMGVFAAQQIMPSLHCNIGRRIAVNGTPRPVDDEQGIPVGIFEGTLANMNARNLLKFYKRMRGSAAIPSSPANDMARDLSDVIEELRIIGLRAKSAVSFSPSGTWDIAVLSTADAIFPIQNQRSAWLGIPTVEIEGPHLPDFQHLIDRLLINKELVSHRFTQAKETYHSSATVQAMIAYDLWIEVADLVGASFFSKSNSILEVGSGTGIFTSLYAPFVRNADWQLWDIAAMPESAVPNGAKFCQVDAEMAIRELPDNSVDAILSSSAIQWFSSPLRFLKECARVLRKGGLLAISTFAPENMEEIRALLPDSSLITPSLRELEQFLSEHFSTVKSSQNKYQMLFKTPREVLEHMRLTGVNALRPASIAQVRRLMESYPRSSTNRCSLSYLPLILVATK